jgi:hypothetical protein
VRSQRKHASRTVPTFRSDDDQRIICSVARLRTVFTVAILGGVPGACGVVEGLSPYSKEDCSQGCGDAAAEVSTTPSGADAAQEGACPSNKVGTWT